MTKYKVEVIKETCIGCGSCASVCGDNFELKDDGKSHVKNEEIDDSGFECSKSAAEACPVQAIHITDKESGEKVI
ncbi:MAG: ferredoxin [Candidatus Woesearchaeota archaeon]